MGIFLGLYSVPLLYVSVLMPLPDCFDYCGLVMWFDIRYCDPSYLVLLSQNCCSCSGSFMVPYKFLKCSYSICEICHWYFNRDCIESINCFGYYGHFDDVNSSFHEHNISFHLFVSSLISSVLCSFLLPPWLGLFLDTLFFFLL